MHEEMTHCAAFDPLAIDELPLISQPTETPLDTLAISNFPPLVKKHIDYDPKKKILVFKRLMSMTERDILKGLTDDPFYKAAIDNLFEPNPPFLEFNPRTNPNHRWPLLDPQLALLPDD